MGLSLAGFSSVQSFRRLRSRCSPGLWSHLEFGIIVQANSGRTQICRTQFLAVVGLRYIIKREDNQQIAGGLVLIVQESELLTIIA